MYATLVSPSADSGLAATASTSCDHVLVPQMTMDWLPVARIALVRRLL